MESLDSSVARELTHLLIVTEERPLDEQEMGRLAELLKESPEACQWMAQLTWQRQELTSLEAKPLAEDELLALGRQLYLHAGDGELAGPVSKALSETPTSELKSSPGGRSDKYFRRPGVGLFIGGLVTGALAACIGFLLVLQNLPDPPGGGASLDTAARVAELDLEENLVRPAVFVTATTACVWGDSAGGDLQVGDPVLSGREIKLIEGIAEVEHSAGATKAHFRIEGPASVVFTADGVPSLRYGKMIVDNTYSMSKVTIEAPVGDVSVDEGSVLGIVTYSAKAALHVFRGAVIYRQPRFASEPPAIHEFNAGQSGFVLSNPNGISVQTGKANANLFAASRSMGEAQLDHAERYVESVMKSKPIAYWRFEELRDGAFENEVSSRFPCQTTGVIELAGAAANRSLELNSRNSATLFVEDSFDDLIDNEYSIECWMKPSHYHRGTMVAMVGLSDVGLGDVGLGDVGLGEGKLPVSAAVEPAMLLELYAIDITPTTQAHPGRVRFLHRNPPSRGRQGGTSCTSRTPYRLRQWQHIVATKRGDQMKLYHNGHVTGVANDSKQLPEGLTLFVGRQELEGDWVRNFLGELDEVAIYNRALGQSEIQRHFDSIKVKVSKPDMI